MLVIYKILSPSGRVYIGQSRNLEIRLRSYRSGNCKKHPKLQASINKYGWDNHKFSIIHELPKDCEQIIVDNYEQIYMDLYRGSGVQLLNIREAGSRGAHSKESIKRMKGKVGKWMIGRKLSDETIKRRTQKQKGMKRSCESKERYRLSRLGEKNPMFGKPPPNKKLTDEQVLEIKSRKVERKYGHNTKLAREFNVSPSRIFAIRNK